ncbi:nucleotidyltransferase family protein [Micromonospora halotolerans]|uniref:Nucleotidyltransferase family protein n=1 Tax=Micromonospora halotolerans TaxID=709879 RepID=A0ABZ0A3C3_9ACTN|nr:nucleotidyltransferase family protein [Micromonospora halotolerans]WNM41924.1 nucleotidyltransferase family protein [Micromonospora halotolerans]
MSVQGSASDEEYRRGRYVDEPPVGFVDPLSTEPRSSRTTELAGVIASCPWLLDVLRTVRESGLSDAWVGAGVLRDLVWGERYGGGFDPRDVRDVDVAFFDANDLTPGNDAAATELLRRHDPAVPWEATNQAAVHTWYESVFGTGRVAALHSIADAVATWPETATCVAVRLDAAETLHVCAPFGLDDLLDGVWRRNPRRITVELSRARLSRHDPGRRWPRVTVAPP